MHVYEMLERYLLANYKLSLLNCDHLQTQKSEKGLHNYLLFLQQNCSSRHVLTNKLNTVQMQA